MRSAVQASVLVLGLVVVGSLAVVAVVRIREAAARTQCQNNLKQLGLALGNYHDTFARFPPAAMPNPELPPERRLSWLYCIVPFVEADTLYRKVDQAKGWDAEENRFAALRAYPIMVCPSNQDREPVSTLEPTSYVGIAGLGADAVSLPEGDARAGCFGYERKLKVDDVRERSGNILMVLETAQVESAWTAAGRPTARGLERGGLLYVGAGGQFGGIHRGGAGALFADGSVRFLEEPVDPAALEAMVVVGKMREDVEGRGRMP
jgi:prepilin-type processing-associated H-X9-DG protein